MKINRKSSRTPFVAAVLIVAVLSLGAVFWYFSASGSKMSDTPNTINYDPPTKQDKKEAEDNKKELAKDTASSDKPKDSTSTQTIQVAVSDATQYGDVVEVRAFIPEVIESDGSCTAIFTLNDNRLEKKVAAFIEATTTQCRPIDVPVSEFSQSGTWNLVVKYNSAYSRGESSIRKVEVR